MRVVFAGGAEAVFWGVWQAAKSPAARKNNLRKANIGCLSSWELRKRSDTRSEGRESDAKIAKDGDGGGRNRCNRSRRIELRTMTQEVGCRRGCGCPWVRSRERLDPLRHLVHNREFCGHDAQAGRAPGGLVRVGGRCLVYFVAAAMFRGLLHLVGAAACGEPRPAQHERRRNQRRQDESDKSPTGTHRPR